MVEVKNKLGKVHEKPYIVRDYNDGMAGINRSNQRCFHVTQAFENQPDGTRLVSITLRFLFSMHIGSTQNLEKAN